MPRRAGRRGQGQGCAWPLAAPRVAVACPRWSGPPLGATWVVPGSLLCAPRVRSSRRAGHQRGLGQGTLSSSAGHPSTTARSLPHCSIAPSGWVPRRPVASPRAAVAWPPDAPRRLVGGMIAAAPQLGSRRWSRVSRGSPRRPATPRARPTTLEGWSPGARQVGQPVRQPLQRPGAPVLDHGGHQPVLAPEAGGRPSSARPRPRRQCGSCRRPGSLSSRNSRAAAARIRSCGGTDTSARYSLTVNDLG